MSYSPRNKSQVACVVLLLVSALVSRVGTAAPHYEKDDIGVFGHGETWTAGSPHKTLDDLNDRYDARFTALENVTVDRAALRYSGADAGTFFNIGLQGDSGGDPDGTYIASANIAATDGTIFHSFGSASLNAGSVYHLVVEPTTVTGNGFLVYASAGSNDIRPFDRALDTSLNSLTSTTGGATWSVDTRDPFFILANGADTAVVVGPGQPISGVGAPSNQWLKSTSTTSNGQQFVITDKEISSNAVVEVTQISIAAQAANSPANDLLIRFREADGTILGTASMTAAQADNTVKTLALDGTVALAQGVTYLLTTEFTGIAPQEYRLGATRADSGPATNWGGTTISFPISSTDAWATYGPRGDRSAFDLVFSFEGLVVVPEPATAGIFALGISLLGFVRRRRAK